MAPFAMRGPPCYGLWGIYEARGKIIEKYTKVTLLSLPRDFLALSAFYCPDFIDLSDLFSSLSSCEDQFISGHSVRIHDGIELLITEPSTNLMCWGRVLHLPIG